MTLRERWAAWQKKINALSLRERLLVFGAAAVVVLALLQLLLVDPVLQERAKLKRQAAQLQQQIVQQQGQREVLEAMLAVGPNRALQERREQLAAQVAQLEQQLQESVVGLIPPQLMAEVLENVLSQHTELELLNIENQQVTPLVEQGPEREESAPERGLYRHGFTLQLRGSYPAAIQYFEKLSALPWRFYWDSLHYEVQDYPQATITLDVYTVSLSEEWISV